MPTLADLEAALLSYTANDNPDFIVEVPAFIRASEERIFYFVQLPFFRKAQVGSFTASTPYLQLPEDFLAPASLAVIDSAGAYAYLINKDVNWMREVYPDPAVEGVPTHYALFDADEDDTTIIVAPTPAANYATELDYYYRPPSLTTLGPTGETWLSVHAYDTLLYGALDEASTWMKRNSGIDNMGDVYGQRFLVGLQGLKNLGESRDRKDTYRGGEKRQPE